MDDFLKALEELHIRSHSFNLQDELDSEDVDKELLLKISSERAFKMFEQADETVKGQILWIEGFLVGRRSKEYPEQGGPYVGG